MSAPIRPTEPGSEPVPAAAPPSRWRPWQKAAVGAAAVVITAAAGVGVAQAGGGGLPAAAATLADGATAPADGCARGPRRGPHVQGTIEAIDGSSLTLAAEDGTTVSVGTTAETTVVDVTEGSLDDVTEGATVRVAGERTDDTVAAMHVLVGDGTTGFGAGAGRPGGPPPADDEAGQDTGEDTTDTTDGDVPAPPSAPPGEAAARPEFGGMVVGTVASVDGESFVVTAEDGASVTVTTSTDTTVTVARQISVDDLAVDDEVSVAAATEGEVLTAATIRRGEVEGFAGPGGRPGGPGGPDA